MPKAITFFEELQKSKEIDNRDKRGSRHHLPLILLEFVLALLCGRDGNQSSIHRHMVSHHDETVGFLNMEGAVPKKR